MIQLSADNNENNSNKNTKFSYAANITKEAQSILHDNNKSYPIQEQLKEPVKITSLQNNRNMLITSYRLGRANYITWMTGPDDGHKTTPI
jgi:hypothetical protein